MKKIIEISGLSKSFGKHTAVDGISFSVREGELFAFLGINGAGKSTTINVICQTLMRDGGEVIIDGRNIDEGGAELKRKLGIVFQSSALDKPLSVRDNLKSRAALYGILGTEFKKRLAELTELLDLSDLLDRTLSKLSGGQRRRIDIARALLHRPKILILDEPTTGLDPQTRNMIWNIIESLRKKEGMTVFLTTHYMEEAAEADYVVIIDKGRIVAEGTPLELKTKYAKDHLTLYDIDQAVVENLSLPYTRVKNGYRIELQSTEDATAIINKHSDMFSDFEITKGRMDDVFLNVTGKALTKGDEAR